MANTPLPVQVDYTSRDYASLREDMIVRVRSRLPEWDASDPADFGVALVEAFAYMGDLMSYYIDRAANESTLSTATRRASVVALARDLGYSATGYSAATVTVTMTNTTGSPIEIPAGSVFSADIESGDVVLSVPFETTVDTTVPDSTPTDVVCWQGETRVGEGYGEVLGTSTGSPSMIFEIPESNVVKESVAINVFDGVNYLPWLRVEHLSDYSPLSRVYRVVDNGSGLVYVLFGDGVSGLVPSASHVILGEYRVVDGLNGNVPAGTITELTSVVGLTEGEVAVLSGAFTVINDAAASGGTDPEELESIRRNGAQAYRATARAVTLDDYQSIALGIPTCGKASAQSEVPGSVLVAVAPMRDTGAAEEYPGFEELVPGTWTPAEEVTVLQAAVLAQIEVSKMAGVQVTMIDPVYTYLTISLDVEALSSVRVSDAQSIIEQAITERLDYARAAFGAEIYTTDLVALVSSLGVASTVTVTVLNTDGGAGVGTVTAADDEILLLLEDDLTVVVTGGVEGL